MAISVDMPNKPALLTLHLCMRTLFDDRDERAVCNSLDMFKARCEVCTVAKRNFAVIGNAMIRAFRQVNAQPVLDEEWNGYDANY